MQPAGVLGTQERFLGAHLKDLISLQVPAALREQGRLQTCELVARCKQCQCLLVMRGRSLLRCVLQAACSGRARRGLCVAARGCRLLALAERNLLAPPGFQVASEHLLVFGALLLAHWAGAPGGRGTGLALVRCAHARKQVEDPPQLHA